LEQYFTPNPSSESNEKTYEANFNGRTYPFTTDRGVFSKDGLDSGSKILIKAVLDSEEDPHGKVLDLGCGYGPVGIILAANMPDSVFTLTDINERAIGLAGRNSAANGISNITTVLSDGLTNIDGLFDLIVTNPPIRIGKANVANLMREAHDALVKGGRFYAVIRKQQGAESYKKILQDIFGNCSAIEKKSGYHVLRAVN
jgi:16S rRNA (guanine1207-N2)-methyltransferase